MRREVRVQVESLQVELKYISKQNVERNFQCTIKALSAHVKNYAKKLQNEIEVKSRMYTVRVGCTQKCRI